MDDYSIQLSTSELTKQIVPNKFNVYPSLHSIHSDKALYIKQFSIFSLSGTAIHELPNK